MLLAVTNHVCQDVAAVPFLWVMPLSLYLLSFIVSFEHDVGTPAGFGRRDRVALAGVVVNDFTRIDHPLGLPLEASLNFAALFFVCMVCHGELARLKPQPRRLTEFYLMIAAGGALGGLFVAVVAPLVFRTFLEWQIGVLASALLAIGLLVLPRFAGKRGILCYTLLSPLVARGTVVLSSIGESIAVPPVDRTEVSSALSRLRGATVEDAQRKRRPTGVSIEARQRQHPARLPIRRSGQTPLADHLLRRDERRGPSDSRPAKIRPHSRRRRSGWASARWPLMPDRATCFASTRSTPQVIDMAKKHFTFLADCRGQMRDQVGRRPAVAGIGAAGKRNSTSSWSMPLAAIRFPYTSVDPRGVRYLSKAPRPRRRDRGARLQQVSAAGPGGAAIGRELRDGGLADRRLGFNASHLQSGSLWVLVTQNDRFLRGRIPPIRPTGATTISRRRSGPTSTAICSRFLRPPW